MYNEIMDRRGAIMNNNESRVIVVTGAAKLDGIGAKTCQVFKEKEPDCKIVVLDVLEDRAREWMSSVDDSLFIRTDVSNKADVENAKKIVMDKYGRLPGPWYVDPHTRVQAVFPWRT